MQISLVFWTEGVLADTAGSVSSGRFLSKALRIQLRGREKKRNL